MFIYAHAKVKLGTSTYLNICMCVYIQTHVYVSVYTHVYVSVYMHTHSGNKVLDKDEDIAAS